MRSDERDTEIRRKAEAVLAQRKKQDDNIVKQREKDREAAADKVARLRELRLAKEADDAQANPKPPKRSRR